MTELEEFEDFGMSEEQPDAALGLAAAGITGGDLPFIALLVLLAVVFPFLLNFFMDFVEGALPAALLQSGSHEFLFPSAAFCLPQTVTAN